jgi:hypothetical protein
MSRSPFKGSDHSAAINGSQLVPDPPIRSAFNGGGGGGPMPLIPFAQIWTVQDGAHKSTVYNASRTPPSVLPLMEGGGGPSSMLKNEQRSAVTNPAHRSTVRDGFRTPLGVLSLIKGGGSGSQSSSQRILCYRCYRPIGSRVSSYLTLRPPRTSPSTEPTCPTCVRI